MSRELLAAGIVRDIKFDSKDSMEIYFYKLQHNFAVYKILDKLICKDGSVIVRVLQQYNYSPLIELYE